MSKPICVYLIERGQAVNHVPTIWWCGGNRRSGVSENEMYNWTGNANKARRFPTAEEAQRLAEDLFGRSTYRVTEHFFLDRSDSLTIPEKLIPIVVKALREISEWGWEVDRDPRRDMDWNMEIVSSSRNPVGNRLTVAFMANESGKNLTKWEANANFIASSPRWLAQMVVGIVEKEAWLKADGNGNPQYDVALRDFGLSEDDWRWLKGKIDGN